MDTAINYYAIASVLLANPERDGILLTPMQLEYLDDCMEAILTEKEKEVLRHSEIDWVLTREGQSAINKLRKIPKLMAILCLGDCPTKRLIDVLACMITGEYEAIIYEDGCGGYSLQFQRKDPKEDEEKSNISSPIIHDFLEATIYYGHPSPYRKGSFVDSRKHVVDRVYLLILKCKQAPIITSVGIDPNLEQILAFDKADIRTNGQLLDFFVDHEGTEVSEPFDKALFDQIEEYFTFWIGKSFRNYAHLND